MEKLLLHWWAIQDYNSVPLTCPGFGVGDGGPVTGFYDGKSVAFAYHTVGALSLVAVLAIVSWVYMGGSATLGPAFVRRWYKGIAVSAVACAAIGLVLYLFNTHAAASSCGGVLASSIIRLPFSYILARVVVGVFWGPVMYVVFSVLATMVFGRIAGINNGFFHNRGCPLPRYRP